MIGLICGYLGVHFGWRLLAGPSLGIDDAEQVLFAQTWSRGYRLLQPPLYTWLVVPVVEALGPGVLASSLVRYLLLGLTYVFLYLAARRWIADPRLAALAVFSFALIYVFAYYAHHDLTHTTALGALVAATFYVFARLVERPHAGHYALLGVCVGLGMLAKYNYVMLAAGLALACLVHADFRPLVRNRKTALALAVAAVIVTPSALWVLAHGGTPGAVAHEVLVEGDAPTLGATLATGTLELIEATVLFPQPLVVVFALVFGPSLWRALRAPASARTLPGAGVVTPGFLGLLVAATLALHWLLVPTLDAVAFTERWMHPALMALPIALFMLVERGRPPARAIAVYLVVVALMVALALGARIARHALGADYCGKCREMVRFATLAEDLRAAGFAGGTIVVPPEEFHIGGNLRVAFPDSRIIDPAYPPALWPAPRDHGQCLVVWDATRANAGPPRASLAYLREHLEVPEDAPRESARVEASMFGSATRRYALGYILLPEGPGQCR